MKLNLQYFAEKTEDNSNEPTNNNKMFTQEDVNKIISKRLAEEKNKNEAEFSKKEAELKEREFKLTAKQLIRDAHLPDDFIDVLNCKDEDTLKSSIEVVKNYIDKQYKVEHKIVGTGVYSGSSNINTKEDFSIRKAMGLIRR